MADLASKQDPRSAESQNAAVEDETGEKAIAAGLANLFLPVVKELDLKIQAVLQSQSSLSDQIDALTQELNRFTGVAQTPSLAPYVNKLLSARRRVYNLSTTLRNIKDRLDRLQILVNEQRARRQRISSSTSAQSYSNIPATTSAISSLSLSEGTKKSLSEDTSIADEQTAQQAENAPVEEPTSQETDATTDEQ